MLEKTHIFIDKRSILFMKKFLFHQAMLKEDRFLWTNGLAYSSNKVLFHLVMLLEDRFLWTNGLAYASHKVLFHLVMLKEDIFFN
jgi:hypothetical protein